MADRSQPFGKMPRDVNSIRSKFLSPIGKLVFAALADEAKATDRTVWLSDGILANRCGVSRTSVIASIPQLKSLKLIVAQGSPVKQVQGYSIPMFGVSAEVPVVASMRSKPAKTVVLCGQCNKLRGALTKTGWCRSCNAVKRTERIARRVAREEIAKNEAVA